MSKSRIEALSDGVFAVAMTLLVFGFKVSDTGISGLHLNLSKFWPQLGSYVLSFVIVGVYWVAHHTHFHFISKTNRTLLWLNNFFLMAVAFLPFPASLLGQYTTSQEAVIFYGCTLMVANTTLTLTWAYASGAGLMHPGLPARYSRFVVAVTLTPALVYAAAMASSFFSRIAPLVLFAAVPAFFIVPNRLVGRRVAEAIAATGGQNV